MADAHTPATEEESEDFKLMRAYDKEWSGPRLVLYGAIALAIAIAVIYGLAASSQMRNEASGRQSVGITVP